tara:strand:+ start:581 stop:1906 length:1326 start_codon:yes stop_codon:yes gene_type:complete
MKSLNDNYKIITLILIFLSFSSFFLGFYFDENSAGAGGLYGDFSLNWANLQIFLNNDLLTAINYTDNSDPDNFYNSSRPPLVYVLHKLFNPFLETELSFRRSVFLISLSGPIIFYFCLKQKFKKENNLLLILIASLILLSPYYRTSSYWALDENYSFISLLISFIFLNKFLETSEENNKYKVYIHLIFLTFFSSLCIYFDPKLLIIPIICFFKIITSKKMLTLKIFSILFYIIFSIPYIYLIILWGNFIVPNFAEGRGVGSGLFLGNIGYLSTMIAFYLLPLLLFKEKNLIDLIKNFFSNNKNYFLIFLFFIYLFYLIYFYDFEGQEMIGKGFIHKFSLILFQNYLLQKIFIYFSFFISWLIILIFIEKNFHDTSILLYFFLISIIQSWLLQEYIDPLILIMAFTFFSSQLFINYKNSIFLFCYLSFLLISSNIYYFNLIK